MKKLILLFLAVFSVSLTFAISGPIMTSTWPAGAPIYINGDCIIPYGETLTIEEGVDVFFDGNHQFVVEGDIHVLGSPNNYVTFSFLPGVTIYRGIVFIPAPQATNNSFFRYAIFDGLKKKMAPGSANPEHAGGAIWIQDYNHLSFFECQFLDCFGSMGGAFYCNNSSPVISSCLFQSNIATDNGGAVYLKDFNPTSAVSGNTMKLNSTKRSGGGMFVFQSTAKFLNLRVDSNTASVEGGGICIRSSNIDLVSSQVNYNNTDRGGGIHSTDCTMKNDELVVSRNTGNYGGGMYIYQSTVLNQNCQFRYNESGVDGGGLYITNASNVTCRKDLNLPDVAIIGNDANNNGGGIFCIDSDLLLENTSSLDYLLSGCVAGNYGGALYAKNTNLDIINTKLNDNDAVLKGGGAYIENSDVDMNNSMAHMNGAYEGAGIFLYYNNRFDCNSTYILDNTAMGNGGGLYLDHSDNNTFEHSTIDDGTSYMNGGGMYGIHSEIEIDSSFILGCTSILDGGGIYAQGGRLAITYTELKQNRADDGGAIYSASTDFWSIYNTYEYNDVDQFGGHIYFDNNNTGGAIWLDKFLSGDAYEGTAIYADNSSYSVRLCIFKENGNLDRETRGTFYAANSTGHIVGSVFEANEAGSSSCYHSSISETDIYNCTFVDNVNSIVWGEHLLMSSLDVLNSCILWDNINGNNLAGYNASNVTYSDIQGQGSAIGTTNIDANPMFAAATYNPTAGSTCINTGDPALVSGVFLTTNGDIYLNNRFVGQIDKGAVEFQGTKGAITAIELSKQTQTKVYPIPSNGEITVEADQIQNITIFDNVGKQIFHHEYSLENKIKIDLSSYPKGVYYLHAITKQGIQTQKIVLY